MNTCSDSDPVAAKGSTQEQIDVARGRLIQSEIERLRHKRRREEGLSAPSEEEADAFCQRCWDEYFRLAFPRPPEPPEPKSKEELQKERDDRQRRIDRWHLTVGAIVFLSSVSPFVTSGSFRSIAWPIIALVDAYIFVLLYYAARNADSRNKWKPPFPYLPNRVASLGISALLILTLVCSFAHLYSESKDTCVAGRNEQIAAGEAPDACVEATVIMTDVDAIYFSFSVITTLGIDDYQHLTSRTRALSALELASGLLFFILAIPVFASRLAGFGRS